MTTFTDKELIKEIKERIGSLDVRDNIERRAYEIALASLEAEPIAWECGENIILFNPDTVEAYAKRAEISPKPLYAASPVSVTPDGWISCSERMPNDAQWCVVNTKYGYYVQCWSEGQGWLGDDISIPECDVINWMTLPEPPQEVK
ncbi:TPA: DUF551 domain-containing protein [Escherichia coli]|nr:DUF551 domain-containing protein [Escherichia coli]